MFSNEVLGAEFVTYDLIEHVYGVAGGAQAGFSLQTVAFAGRSSDVAVSMLGRGLLRRAIGLVGCRVEEWKTDMKR